MNGLISSIFYIGMGGALGAICRYMMGLLVGATNPDAPKFLPTLVVNVVGSFLIGILVTIGRHYSLTGSPALLFLVTGFCGGFTTFSTFTLEVYDAFIAGTYRTAAFYLIISIVAGLIALIFGIRLTKYFI